MEELNPDLSPQERQLLMDLFEQNLLKDHFRDEQGKTHVRILRSHFIDVKEPRFEQRIKKEKTLQKLLDKKILVKGQIWYRFYLKKEYMRAVYNLADNGNWELVAQMAGVWIEIQKDQEKPSSL